MQLLLYRHHMPIYSMTKRHWPIKMPCQLVEIGIDPLIGQETEQNQTAIFLFYGILPLIAIIELNLDRTYSRHRNYI